MGYRTYFQGRIDIEPPLNYAELKDLKEYWYDCTTIGKDIAIEVDIEKVEHDHGVTQVYWGRALIPASEDEYKGYDIEPQTRNLITKFSADHEFSGMIIAHGEENADIWRMVVRDNQLFTEHAALSWPDGTETNL